MLWSGRLKFSKGLLHIDDIRVSCELKGKRGVDAKLASLLKGNLPVNLVSSIDSR
jgi:hypothetical protein